NEASFIVEVVSLTADRPAGPGELGRVVVTDLFSHAMPLIRYDTGDLAIAGTSCRCGRATRTLERVEGRVVEMLTTADGERLSPFFLNPIMRRAAGVRQFQFAQVGPSAYELRVVGGVPDALLPVAKEIGSKLGKGAAVDVRLVPDIPALP